jgi:hypothetical protein
MCTLPNDSQGVKLGPNQFLVTNQLEATGASAPCRSPSSGKITVNKDLRIKGKLCISDCNLVMELDCIGTGLSSSGGGSKSKLTNVQLNLNAKGLMYITAQGEQMKHNILRFYLKIVCCNNGCHQEFSN